VHHKHSEVRTRSMEDILYFSSNQSGTSFTDIGDSQSRVKKSYTDLYT
jgi:hypothetical protein